MERTTITVEEWKAIDNITNYTMNLIVKTSMSDGSKINISRLLKSTGVAEYHKDFQNSVVIADCYNFLSNSQKYSINHWNDDLENRDYKNWYIKESDWEPKSMNDGLGWIEIDYEYLIYDEAEKAYVYTIAKDGLTCIFSYYFVDGKLIKASALLMILKM